MKPEFGRRTRATATILHESGAIGLGRSCLLGLLLLIGALVFVVRPFSHRSHDRYSRLLFSGLDGLHCKRTDADARRALDCSSVPSEAIPRSGAAHLFMPDDHLHVRDLDFVLPKLTCIKQPRSSDKNVAGVDCLSGWSCRATQVHSQDCQSDHRCGRGADHTLRLGNHRTTSADR